MNPESLARGLLPALACALALGQQAAVAAEPVTQPAKAAKAAAKPADKAMATGIIVLDGKAPPAADAKGQAATGIGLGGCAACDKTDAGKKPAAKARQAAAAK